MMQSDNYIFYLCQGGIGNRLKYLASQYIFYKPKKYTIVWKKEGWVTKSFLELFSIKDDCEMIELCDKKSIKKYKEYFHKEFLYTQGYHWRLYANENIDLKYNEISEYNKLKYLNFFSKITPSEKVMIRLNEISISKDCIALQIRNNNDWKKVGRNENLDNFVEEMLKYPPDSKFFISCMSENVSKFIKNKFPGRIIELPNKDYNSMIDAVADMFLISYCNRGIYSYASTFPEVAWWLGGAKAKVTIVGGKDLQTHNKQKHYAKNLVNLLKILFKF